MSDSTFNVIAFVLDDHSQQIITQLAADIDNQNIQVQKGDINKAKEWCTKHGAPDLLLVDGGDCVNLDSALSELSHHCPPQMKLIVLGKKQEVTLYRHLMFAGVNDYHTTPLDADALRLSLLHLQGHQVKKSLRTGKIICVLGSSGGCGVSTIASNLGYYLAEKQSQHVALVDLDVFHSQHPILLGTDYEPNLENILKDADRIDETLLAHSSHQFSKTLHLFYGQDSQLPSDNHGSITETIQALAEHYGTVIIDIPNLHNPAMLDVIEKADNCIYVTDYSLNSYRFLAKLRARVQSTHQRQILVGNLCRKSKGRVPKAELSKSLGLDLSLELPFDAKAFEKSELLGKPIMAQSTRFSKKLAQLGQIVSSASSAAKR
ncbi:AAA family ATPase [Vibrio nigripulchritudo]|uniref:AAA family ATPase n=1 Tax=Vibrio nigripulchritudo TaxID=28173 RepID=UPI0003B1CA81|nr:AAA family ATPase [Vibrio nigripulchritudo]CCN72265.1 putative Flp pilus assembly protein, ATPase CpaE [Vibrio nigripulchritudo SFn118]